MQRRQNTARGERTSARESPFDVVAIMTGEVSGYDVLSRTPFNDYPETGARHEFSEGELPSPIKR
jgi:hypothetical protein